MGRTGFLLYGKIRKKRKGNPSPSGEYTRQGNIFLLTENRGTMS